MPALPTCMDASEENLYVGCVDMHVRVLNITAKTISKIFKASDGVIKVIFWYNNILFVAGYDPVLRGWDIDVFLLLER